MKKLNSKIAGQKTLRHSSLKKRKLQVRLTQALNASKPGT